MGRQTTSETEDRKRVPGRRNLDQSLAWSSQAVEGDEEAAATSGEAVKPRVAQLIVVQAVTAAGMAPCTPSLHSA